jgi:hypothetical protein
MSPELCKIRESITANMNSITHNLRVQPPSELQKSSMKITKQLDELTQTIRNRFSIKPLDAETEREYDLLVRGIVNGKGSPLLVNVENLIEENNPKPRFDQPSQSPKTSPKTSPRKSRTGRLGSSSPVSPRCGVANSGASSQKSPKPTPSLSPCSPRSDQGKGTSLKPPRLLWQKKPSIAAE